MTDPIETLRTMEPESPPRAVVLASLRLFRYRVLAVAAIVVAAVIGLAWVATGLRTSSLPDEVRDVIEHDAAVFQPAAGTQMIGNVRVSVTEVASSPAGSAARLIFEDVGSPERDIQVEVVAIRQGSAELGPVVNVPSLGRDNGRATAAVWVPLDEQAEPFGAEIEILILPIPDSILDEGGDMSSDDGITGIVTIERATHS